MPKTRKYVKKPRKTMKGKSRRYKGKGGNSKSKSNNKSKSRRVKKNTLFSPSLPTHMKKLTKEQKLRAIRMRRVVGTAAELGASIQRERERKAHQARLANEAAEFGERGAES